MLLERGRWSSKWYASNASQCVYFCCTHAFMGLSSVVRTCKTHGHWSVFLGNRDGRRRAMWALDAGANTDKIIGYWIKCNFVLTRPTDKAQEGCERTSAGLKQSAGLWKFSHTFTVEFKSGKGLGVCYNVLCLYRGQCFTQKGRIPATTGKHKASVFDDLRMFLLGSI